MQFGRAQAIVKLHEEKRVVKAPVLRPDIMDRHKTVIGADLIEDACHDFNARLGLGPESKGTGGKVMHSGKQNDRQFSEKVKIVESYITTQDETFKVAQEGGEDAELFVPAGSWMMAMKVLDDDLWDAVKKGLFRGFSIGGLAASEPLEEST